MEIEVEYPFTVKEAFHSKKGIKIWVLKLKTENRLTRESFTQLKEAIKDLGGYYSFYGKGFIFETNPSPETLNDFAGIIQDKQETEANQEKPTIDLAPISQDTNSKFNFFRMFQLDLNQEYAKSILSQIEFIRERTGLDYQDYSPQLLEAFLYYQKILKAYWEEQARSNMTFPNPFMTGRANYRNLEGKRAKAMKIEGKALEKYEYAKKKLERAINFHLKTKILKELPEINFQSGNLNKQIAELRKKHQISIVKTYGGSRAGKKYANYSFQIQEKRIEITLTEPGRLTFYLNNRFILEKELPDLANQIKYFDQLIISTKKEGDFK